MLSRRSVVIYCTCCSSCFPYISSFISKKPQQGRAAFLEKAAAKSCSLLFPFQQDCLNHRLLHVVLVVLVVFPTSARNVPILPLRMKARTRLARIEGMMRHDDRPWIPPLELLHQREQRTLLRLRPRVRRPAQGVQTTLVAHPDAMPVVVQAVRSHLRLGPSPLDASVPSHHIVVADATPAPFAVPRVNLLRARRLAGPYRRAMNNDQSDSSHKNSSERLRPLHLLSTS